MMVDNEDVRCHLRHSVNEKMLRWLRNSSSYTCTIDFLGYPSWFALITAQENNPAFNTLLQKLDGPHGYVIFKAMQIRKAASNDK